MQTLKLWTHTGDNGTTVIRHADGCFVPRERVVEVCFEPEHTPPLQEILQVIHAEYVKRGVPFEYEFQPNVKHLL